MQFARRLLFSSLILLSCTARDEEMDEPGDNSLMQIPAGFPAPAIPADNEINPERFALGKKLFYDPVMSRDSSVSCASCHRPEFAFSDTQAFSKGVNDAPGTRNAPSLANVAYHPYFTREGGVPTLEMQVLVPIQEHVEFDYNILRIAERMNRDSTYRQMSQRAYNRLPDPFVITRSIACFERTLISGNSRYDEYRYRGIRSALNESEKRGMDLFFSNRTQCSSCHGGFNFTRYAFENNGLYSLYADPGRFRLTGDSSDLARFKVPSLRNVELTAPYMHDGSMATLSDVIQHYNTGGKAHPHKNPLIRPLGLTPGEKKDLESFLISLTDPDFVRNPKHR
jgi:cytochrome c peroxidase